MKWSCDDFEPLYPATSNALAIATRPNEDRWSDFPSFIAYLRSNPGKTAYNGASYSLPHLVAAKVMQTFGAVSRPVPYDDLALGLKDLRNGTLDWIIINPGVYAANKEHLKVLVVLSEQKEAQDVFGGAKRPQDYHMDLGISGLAPMGWDWWLVKKGTPADRVEMLRTAMKAAMTDPKIRERILKTGFVPLDFAPADYSRLCTSVRDQLLSAKDAIQWEAEQVKAANQK
jgi:tripartite-type tricarboxylate transporter receptor subunit TctC